MEKQQKKVVKKYISWALIAAIVAVLAFLPVIAAQEEQLTGPQASILNAEAELRNVTTSVLGGGTLLSEDTVNITIPAAVKVKEYLVRNGDMVAEGQPIAKVDRVSTMAAITQVQETIEYLQEQLNDVSTKTGSEKVTATAGGTVKIIYAAEGESVQNVLLRDGALAAISLDGMMALQIRQDSDLSGGDKVLVTLSDGTEVTGKVESNLEGVLTVTVTDEDFPVGAEVTVSTEDGKQIGSGNLYIHSQWNVVAYSGTVSRVRIKEGDTVKNGKVLFDLKDTNRTAEFDSLSRQHQKYEDLMLELFRMYQSETVLAPMDGMVTGVDENGTYMLSDTGAGWTISLLTNAPDGNDEISYLNFIGQVTQVGIDGLILKMNTQPLSVSDYQDLSALPLDPAAMTEEVIYTATAPVYELVDGAWVQIEAESIAAGDILLFAGDSEGNFVWVVRVPQAPVQPEMPDAPQPTDPADPTTPADPETPETTEPSEPTDPTMPSTPNQPGATFPQGGMPGFGGGMVQEESYELYGLDTVTIAAVTAQEEATIQITVDELDITKIYVGQSASVTVEALTGQQFPGTVTSISASGENEGGNSKFSVEVTLEKASDMLAGMSTSVSIGVATAEQVIAIPVAALNETETGTIVYTGYDEEEEAFTGATEVTVGVSDGEWVQVLSGISEGQMVYYAYYDTLVISDAPDMAGMSFFG